MTPVDFTKKVNKIIGGRKIVIDLHDFKLKSLNASVLYNITFDIRLPKEEISEICENYISEISEKLNTQIKVYIKEELINIDKIVESCQDEKFKKELKDKSESLIKDTGTLTKLNSNNILNNVKNKFYKIKNILNDMIEIEKLKDVVSEYYSDNDYLQTFPVARTMHRKFIFHYGPTNSGKTYAALNCLKEAGNGYYLAPLRLLAHEVYEELNQEGFITDLVTGEEKTIIDGSTYRSSTIEMANFVKPVDVAVIDEVQMISDTQRGWAWTQALVGIPANTVILAGSEDAIPNVKYLVEDILHEELELVKFERKNELVVEDHVTTTCKEGDAVIVFSRKRVLELKEQLNNQCSIIYGSLGPEVRKSEANKFREGVNPVVVSTDAIGMGLNLPIRRVIFADIEKFNGYEYEIIDTALIKQIAGRAGRYGKFEKGLVTATDPYALDIIKRAMATKRDTRPLKRFQISPNMEAIKHISEVTGLTDISKVLNQFIAVIDNDRYFMMMDIENMKEVSRHVYKDLPLDIKFLYSCSPVNTKVMNDLNNLYKWSKLHCEGSVITSNDIFFYESVDYNESLRLRTLEDKVKLLTVYLWLSQRFPEIYTDEEIVKEHVQNYNLSIMKMLAEAPKSKRTKKLRIS